METKFPKRYGAKADYKRNKVKFTIGEGELCNFDRRHLCSLIIDYIKARKMLHKGCRRFLVHLVGYAKMEAPI